MPIESHREHQVNSSRRTLLRRSLCSGLFLATTPLRKVLARSELRISLHNLHTGEKVDLPYWAEGQYQQDSLTEINKVLRDHRSGEVYPIDRQLLDLMAALQTHVNSHRGYEVISGYRSPATNPKLHSNSNNVAKRSLHMQGCAIDIRLPGIKLAHLHRAAIDLKAGGVGLYTRSNFIHVDTGRIRYW